MKISSQPSQKMMLDSAFLISKLPKVKIWKNTNFRGISLNYREIWIIFKNIILDDGIIVEKLVYIYWCPDTANVKVKMLAASSN